MSELKNGDLAPDFEAILEDGKNFRLSDLRGKKVILFFYPKDDTPFCTREACGFRDRYTEILNAGGLCLGISKGTKEEHTAFKLKHNLPFPLLVDKNGTIEKLYGVSRLGGLWSARVTFLIQESGSIDDIIHSEVFMSKHIDKSLEWLSKGKSK